jgi:hypothetical protein
MMADQSAAEQVTCKSNIRTSHIKSTLPEYSQKKGDLLAWLLSPNT